MFEEFDDFDDTLYISTVETSKGDTLIVDFLVGDQTLFVRGDEAEEAWRILEPVIGLDAQPESYEAGSWGPSAAEDLITGDGDHWHPQRDH